MKKLSIRSVTVVFVLFLGFALLSGCKNATNPATGAETGLKSFFSKLFPDKNAAKSAADVLDKDTSYAFGMLMANQMHASMGFTDLRFDYNAFLEGFKSYNEAGETRLTPDQAMQKINAVVAQIQNKQNEQKNQVGEKNRQDGDAYLAENGLRSEVTTTASGLQYEVLTQGTGAKPGPNDTVRVQYQGTFIDGTEFDSSYKRGTPAEFGVSQVIHGWTEGLQLMNEGSKFRFVIPSDLAYGPNGSGSIPPNSTLIFTVELLAIVK
ncbi:MAG: FKBP-type peptidyl-prolyl cis-trans isomerase [Treponema sp.]|nr:FKBP-type peptidyl-prolyl cis-trans isomerase [Treponema sp.]